RELHALALAPDGAGEALHEQRLAQAGIVLEEDVPVGEGGGEQLLREAAVAHEHGLDAVKDLVGLRVGERRHSVRLRGSWVSGRLIRRSRSRRLRSVEARASRGDIDSGAWPVARARAWAAAGASTPVR